MTFVPGATRRTLAPRTVVFPYSPACDTYAMNAWGQAAPAGAAWPLANLAIGVPFEVTEQCIAYEVFWATGTGTGGNADVGIYDTAGNRLASTGTTARGSASSWVNTNWTDYTLEVGQYYLAMAANGVETYVSWAPAAGGCESMGVVEATSSFVLPNPITWSRTTRAYIPNFGLNLRSVAL